MGTIKQFLKGPVWATGSYRVLFTRSWAGVLAGVLFSSALFLMPSMVFSRDEMIIIRNDQIPLDYDLMVGRFGVGKLFFDDPVDLDTDEDNNVYILDAGNYRVQVMDEDGDYLYKWGRRGKEDGEFEDPVSLVVDPDRKFVYVLDREKLVVNKYELDGKFAGAFGERGIRKGEFDDPVDLTVDVQGYIYVLDGKRRAVLKFHHSGEFVDEWSFSGRKRRELIDPVSIAYSTDRLGYICVLDRTRRTLVMFNRRGDHMETLSLMSVISEGGEPIKVRGDDMGNLFILEGVTGKLVNIRRSTYSIFSLFNDKISAHELSGLAVDEDGRIYVTDVKKDRIIRFRFEPN